MDARKEKNGVVPIMGRVIINGFVAQFGCKCIIPEELQDVKGSQTKDKSKEAREINLILDNIKAQIIKYYQRLSDREAYVTAKMVRNAYQGIGTEYETLLGAFDRGNAIFKKRVGTDRTTSAYSSRVWARNHVTAFIKANYKHNDMSMIELIPDFIKEFAIFLATDRGLQNDSIWANYMRLKGVIMRIHYNGLTPRSPFVQFHISPNVKEKEFLTEDELKAVMTHDFTDSKLAYIRDLFVFVSFTALLFVDVKGLITDNIVEVNGEKWILFKRHKTKTPFRVKLLDTPLQIIKRYELFQENKLVFPNLNLNYWSICKPLKKMIKECGIDEDISFHCSRHGFATLALNKGVPIENVSRVLGHANIVTTQLYVEITTEKIDKDLTTFGNQLNQSFGNTTMAQGTKRAIITISESSYVNIPDSNVRMSLSKLVGLFDVSAPALKAAPEPYTRAE